MGLTWWFNSAWMLACRREWRAFQHALRHPAEAQAQVLRAILRANATSEFGRRHRFHNIESPRYFQRQVPPADYATFRGDLERIAAGEVSVLTTERVRLLEPTSGTTSGRRLIPYTQGLRREFQRMIAPWIYDLLHHRPALRNGRSYWAISPAIGPRERTSGRIPIGFDDDTAYLAGPERWLVRRLLITPASATADADLNALLYATLLSLVQAEDLALVSVWSPTFLLRLFERLDEWSDRLVKDLGQLPRGRTSRRIRDVASILTSRIPLRDKLQLLWPRLALISCWADASAGMYVDALQDLVPRAEIQPKGLLCTEGAVSFPLLGHRGAVLALRSHFFEFEEVDESGVAIHNGDLLLAHQVCVGRRYRVFMTTSGGLYRYSTDDVVEVVGFEMACPCLVFCGRTGGTSDLVGEKLSEVHVRAAVDRTMRHAGISPAFAMVAPAQRPRDGYCLYLQIEPNAANVALDREALATRLDAALGDNPHYRYAVALGQLQPCQVRVLHGRSGPAWRIYEQRCLSDGQRAGQIKPVALDMRLDWEPYFDDLVESDITAVHRPAETSARASCAQRG